VSEPTQTSTNKQKEKKVSIARLRAIAEASTLRRPAHRRGDETGFSLIELMIVLLIIGILLAVAIPTYLSARDRAENRAAQETLGHVLTSAEADYASQGAFVPLSGHKTMAGYLAAQNPGVTVIRVHISTQTSSAHTVSEWSSDQWLSLGIRSASGRCFYLIDDALGGVDYSGLGTPNADAGVFYGASPGGQSSCAAAYLGSIPPSGWQTTWAAATAAV